MPEIFSSNDLLKLGYEEDDLLLEDTSLCTVCSVTCASTVGHEGSPSLPGGN